MKTWLAAYLATANIFGFALMGRDKSRARWNRWRVRESTLFLTALLGGSLGTLVGMYYFRHKTKHWYFKVFMPVILIVQAIAIYKIYS